MGLGYRNLSTSSAEFTKIYSDIKGVDFSGSKRGMKDGRLPYMENMYRDYSSGDYMLESIPGYRELFKLDGRINAIFCHRVSESEEYMLIHAGDKLYRFAISDISDCTPDLIAELADTVSAGFSHGESFYILDGQKILSVDKNGSCSIVADDGRAPYIPTRFKNLKEYEQANLLTDKFKEELTLGEWSGLTYASEGVTYALTPDNASLCVIGCSSDISGVVYIPSGISIAGEYKPVTEISDLAFQDAAGITGLITNDGLLRIGTAAFKRCTSLEFAVISDTVTHISREAFRYCSSMRTIYVGSALISIGESALANCTALSRLHYPASESEFANIEIASQLELGVTFGSRYRGIRLALPVKTPATEILTAEVNGEEKEFTTTVRKGLVTTVNIDFQDRDAVLGSTVRIYGSSEGIEYPENTDDGDIRAGLAVSLFGNGDMIKKCKQAVLFDGRIFLCGNPDFPNTVFFCSDKHPLYFGAYDYFNDGDAGYSVKSLLPAGDGIFVFKSGDDGGGSIFYHKKEGASDAGIGVKYPVSFTNNAIPALGRSYMFYDDPLFTSELGLCGLEKNSLGGVNAVCRSHNVNQKLLSEDFEGIRFTSWQGYLVLAAGERIYLADSRSTFRHETGGREYEWFYLNGIGAPKGKRHDYIFHSIAGGGFMKHTSLEDRSARDYPIYSIQKEGDPQSDIYFAVDGSDCYYVYKSDEIINDGVYGITDILGVGALLFFGCENGSLMVFNNDKRGIIPAPLTENDPDLDIEDYKAIYGQKIHPYFYSFAGHAPRYVIRTGFDCCDIPHLEKNTSAASLTVKFKSFAGGKMHCTLTTDKEALTDEAGFGTGHISFDNLCFANLSFDGGETPTAVSFDAPKRWIEKEIMLYSDEFRSPMGICSFGYRFKIKGRIKNR